MLVAAHPSDLRAARACGRRTAFIARPLEFGPRAPAALPDPAEFDVAADSLTSLTEQLEA